MLDYLLHLWLSSGGIIFINYVPCYASIPYDKFGWISVVYYFLLIHPFLWTYRCIDVYIGPSILSIHICIYIYMVLCMVLKEPSSKNWYFDDGIACLCGHLCVASLLLWIYSPNPWVLFSGVYVCCWMSSSASRAPGVFGGQAFPWSDFLVVVSSTLCYSTVYAVQD